MPTLDFVSYFPVSATQLFNWHSRPGAFERLNSPWRPVKIISSSGGIKDGARIRLKIPVLGNFGIPLEFAHRNYKENQQFQDYQVHGPFTSWQHTHLFETQSNNSSKLTDRLEYKVATEPLGELINKALIEPELKRLFRYRHIVTKNDLDLITRYNLAPKKFLISGASGLVGSSLSSFLSVAGHSVFKLVRRPTTNSQEIYWNPDLQELNPSTVEGFDAFINLSGENISGRRWNDAFKEQLLMSRVNTTSLLVKTIKKLKRPPTVFISASAIGIYGDRADELLTEESAFGESFLSDLARRWEDEAEAANSVTRVVTPRFGLILAGQGGALKKMLPPFKLGLGGVIGPGHQWMSCIALDDVVGAIYHCVATDSLNKAVNFVSPDPLRNEDFTKLLGKILNRPTLLPLPTPLIKIILGEMGEQLLLASANVSSKKLQNSGYKFLFPDIKSALTHFLI